MVRKGQVTIFVIVAIMIIIAGILIFLFYPQIKSSWTFDAKNPQEFIRICIEEEIKNSLEKVSLQGGSLDPEHYFLYENGKLEYLCYTGEYYKTCIVQQPMLKEHIESEIAAGIRLSSIQCFKDLKTSYEKKGYGVSLVGGELNVELLPNRVVTTFNNNLVLTKEGSETYGAIKVAVDNNLYELVNVANSIINWESNYGDAETTIYMNYYPNLKIEKLKQTDGTTIYILTERDTQNKFRFASRSVAWPPGYGFE